MAAPMAINSYVLALANGGKKDQLSPDDFNPFTPAEKKAEYVDWDEIALEVLKEHWETIPPWLFAILVQCGVTPPKEKSKWERSKSRIYGCAYAIGVDPYELGGVWYWSLLVFKDVSPREIPDAVTMFSWDSNHTVPVPGAFLRHWIGEGGTIYFGNMELG
jgi:hypothetical protein